MVVRPQIQATLLTIVAGIADAVGYITMGGVFAANMTGNTVLAGIAAAQRDYTDAWHHLASCPLRRGLPRHLPLRRGGKRYVR